MGPPHEGSIRRPVAPWVNALTTELHIVPFLVLIEKRKFCMAMFALDELGTEMSCNNYLDFLPALLLKLILGHPMFVKHTFFMSRREIKKTELFHISFKLQQCTMHSSPFCLAVQQVRSGQVRVFKQRAHSEQAVVAHAFHVGTSTSLSPVPLSGTGQFSMSVDLFKSTK